MNSNPSPKPAKRGRRADRPPLWLIYLLLLGPVGFLFTFNYIPAFSALYHAFTSWDVGAESTWVGLANFREILTDPVLHKSVLNLLKLGTFAFIVNLTVPFVLSEMIYHLKSERISYLCRVAVVMPMIVPGVVAIMLWGYIYSDAGVLTELLTNLGLQDYVYGWLTHPKTALWAVAFVGFPFASGVSTLIYYAGLTNIPGSILEAAELDGLGSMGRIVRIHIPLVLQQFKLLAILSMIGVVNGFELVYLLTKDGGPGYETMVPGLYMFLNGFSYQRMGYASAIGLLMLAFLLLFTVSLNRFVRTEDYEPGA